MKLIIAGSRRWRIPVEFLEHVIGNYYGLVPGEIVHGGANGVDASGKIWGIKNCIKVAEFDADWDTHGRAAGPIRNRKMAEYADELLLIWDGKSPGSASMKKEMLRLEKPIHEVIMKATTD